jgi:hypothetical protein
VLNRTNADDHLDMGGIPHPSPLGGELCRHYGGRMRLVLSVVAPVLAPVLAFALWWFVRSRRATFGPFDQLQVVVTPTRVAFDIVGRVRVSKLSPLGTESQFRLNAVDFQRDLPAKRTKSVELGGIRITKDPKRGVGLATHHRTLLLSGPRTDRFALGTSRSQLAVPPRLSPLWMLSGDPTDDPTNVSNGARTFDGVLVVAVSDLGQIPMVERSVLVDLPNLVRSAYAGLR